MSENETPEPESLHIITLDEILAELGEEDGVNSVSIARLCAGIEGRFESHCRRGIWRRPGAVETYDGGGLTIYLRNFPVEEIDQVEVESDTLAADAYVSGDYRGRLYRSDRLPWPAGVENIRVTYTGGYASPGGEGVHEMPADLRRAVRMQAGFEWRNREAIGRQSVSAQGQSISLAPAKLLPEVQDMLQPYRRYA